MARRAQQWIARDRTDAPPASTSLAPAAAPAEGNTVAAGRPVAGADVRARQVSHAFPFGTCVRADKLWAPQDEKYRQILTERGFGYANVEKKTPVDPKLTLFRPGSVSKLITWTAVMQQVEQGKIDLDADVNKYLEPEFRSRRATASRSRCATSCSTRPASKSRSRTSSPRIRPSRATSSCSSAGHRRAYSTPAPRLPTRTATSLAGYIVERVSGDRTTMSRSTSSRLST
jgi:CubicO group peptidase (beta-lactamase class C family)